MTCEDCVHHRVDETVNWCGCELGHDEEHSNEGEGCEDMEVDGGEDYVRSARRYEGL